MTDDNVLPEERGVSHVVVLKLAPLHHVVRVQLTGGVHVRYNVHTHLEFRLSIDAINLLVSGAYRSN